MTAAEKPGKPDLVGEVAEAMSTFDARIAWYLDKERTRVVKVTAGVCNDRTLDGALVDKDEERFVEIPPLTRAREHDWMTDFVDGHDNPRLGRMLDSKKGANERFLDRLSQHHQAVIQEWNAFRAERLREMAEEWLP